jgi:hypothetical protein
MRRTGLIIASALLAYGTAFAQETPPAETPVPGDAQDEAVANVADDSTLAESAQLSNEEKKKRTEQMLTEMRSALQRATDILGEARGAKDVVQLNCVNDKLAQIKGLLKIGEQSSVRMYEAIAEAADDVVNHEFTKLAVAHQKTLILRSEADQCVGETTIYTGDTEVEVEIDPTIQQGDPTATPFPEVSPETPEIASQS